MESWVVGFLCCCSRYWYNKEDPPTAAQCTFPCVNAGGPNMAMVGSTVFTAGVTGNALQRRIARHYQPQDTVSWAEGLPPFKFGGDMDVYVNLWFYGFYSQSLATPYSVGTTLATIGAANAATYPPNRPTKITSTADLYKLPLSTGQAYLGNLILPAYTIKTVNAAIFAHACSSRTPGSYVRISL